MPPIERDPHLEVCPDFASAHYDPLRALIINAGSTEEEAVAQMTNAWQQENEARREDWNHQIEDEQRAREEADQLARQQEQEEQDAARREKEKKKPKIGDFEANRSVSTFIPPRPSSYALNKLESFEYIELFYFTLEGCLDAVKSTHRSRRHIRPLQSRRHDLPQINLCCPSLQECHPRR